MKAFSTCQELYCDFSLLSPSYCFVFRFSKDVRNTGAPCYITETRKRRYNKTCPWTGAQIVQGASETCMKYRKNSWSLWNVQSCPSVSHRTVEPTPPFQNSTLSPLSRFCLVRSRPLFQYCQRDLTTKSSLCQFSRN